MTGQSHPTQPWPVTNQPPTFQPGPWAHSTGHGHPAPGPWQPAPVPPAQFASGHFSPAQAPTGQFPPAQAPQVQFHRTQMPAGAVPPAPGFPGGQWPPPGAGQWGGHPVPPPVRPAATAPRRQGPVAMVSVLLLVLLAVGAGAWVVSGGRVPGTTGGSSGSPVAAPAAAANPLPAGSLPVNPLAAVGAGDFCQTARDMIAKQSAALNDPNADITAMMAQAQETNRKLAAAAPAELQPDFAVFLQVSDRLADALNSGNPQAMQDLPMGQFQAAVEHIIGYGKTHCGIQLDSLAPRGLGG